MTANPLMNDLLQMTNAYWAASHYFSVGQIYIWADPITARPLILRGVTGRDL